MSIQLTNPQKEELFLASGDTHPELAEQIAQNMGVELGNVALRQHPNTEPYVRYEESVRDKHVIVMQPHAPANEQSVSDSLHQHLEMIYAARLASGDPITAVSTNLAGARQDRKSRGRESISIALTLRAMATAGASRIVTVDLHTPQSLAVFTGPSDHLTAQPLLQDEVERNIQGNKSDHVIVAPDVGRAKLAEVYASQLGLDFITMTKTRDPDDPSKIVRNENKIDNVDGRTCFLVDDIVDTAGTIVSAAEVLDKSGATEIHTAATHGFFSGPAVERLKGSPIKQILITDTIPVGPALNELGDQLKVVSVAEMVADALKEIVTSGSVSKLYNEFQHLL